MQQIVSTTQVTGFRNDIARAFFSRFVQNQTVIIQTMIPKGKYLNKGHSSSVSFSIISDAAWAPGVETRDAWHAWALSAFPVTNGSEPALRIMPAMQRRRVSFLGKMALEVAFDCLGERRNVPTIFCSRHGEVSRSVDLLHDLACGEPLSPTSFGLSVHNAIGGLFSIVCEDRTNNIALSAGPSSVEHAAIEACGLLADGEEAVLLIVYDCPLPAIYADYQSEEKFPFAWAWLIGPPRKNVVSLAWSAAPDGEAETGENLPAGLQILRFHLRQDCSLDRMCGKQKWQWSRNV